MRLQVLILLMERKCECVKRFVLGTKVTEVERTKAWDMSSFAFLRGCDMSVFSFDEYGIMPFELTLCILLLIDSGPVRESQGENAILEHLDGILDEMTQRRVKADERKFILLIIILEACNVIL
mmetsp:Transcript_17486/g.33147  ORF Transcript_17486/g.33147 Transcript_17486/m.33147 type:complete len:123 (-) Transcript_17486:224-592(-)